MVIWPTESELPRVGAEGTFPHAQAAQGIHGELRPQYKSKGFPLTIDP